MVISRKKKPPVVSVCVGDQAIDVVQSVNYVLRLTSDLTWALHITTVCSKARKFIGFLHRYLKDAGTVCLARLFRSVVLPVLDYGSAVWDPHQAKYITQLERTQRFAARVVTGRWVRDATPLISQLGWTSLAQRRSYFKLCVSAYSSR